MKINIGYKIPNIEKLVDKISKVIGLIVPVTRVFYFIKE